jgi:hypothetical protein
MTEAESERLSRNLAEVIDDLYRQHAPPRDHERLIQLVQVQIRHAMSLAERSARHGSGRDDRYSADHLGQPDLQALVRQCGGFDKISLELWTAWDRATTLNGRSAVVPDSKHRRPDRDDRVSGLSD